LVCVAYSGCIEAGHIIDSRPKKKLRRVRNEESNEENKGRKYKHEP
jgi:hypothetical protein